MRQLSFYVGLFHLTQWSPVQSLFSQMTGFQSLHMNSNISLCDYTTFVYLFNLIKFLGSCEKWLQWVRGELISHWHTDFNSFLYEFRNKIVRLKEKLDFESTSILFSITTVLIYISARNVWELPLFDILSSICYLHIWCGISLFFI